jgi:hypothetical protein
MYETPRAWAHKGENLIHAFEAIVAASVKDSMHLDLNDQALMLAGMAIEVQIKAILINIPHIRTIVSASKPPSDKSATNIWKAFFSHNLLELAKIANITLTPAQQNVAFALSQYIYWRGRYVVPTERGIDDLIPINLDTGLVGQAHRVATIDSARDLIHCIIDEVKAQLY